MIVLLSKISGIDSREITLENSPAFDSLMAELNNALDALPISDEQRVELNTWIAALLEESGRSAFSQGADTLIDLLDLPVALEAENVRGGQREQEP